MDSVGVRVRDRFRSFPLTDALLFFQPSSGLSIRVENERTRGLARRAPRVVMFGVTNRCNLSCSFCSRDVARSSTWTVESAAAALSGLERAGCLEVAFGGGEPFAFRGFAELVAELHEKTALALNVTTNGTLLDKRGFAPFLGKLGQVRVSIYDDHRWLLAARTLRDAGQLWGANVLVHDRRLDELPALFAQLTALGCHDVSLLNYIGPDSSLELGSAGRARLAAQIESAPLPCRASVCFGDRLPAPRLFQGVDNGGDCGAGDDFITVTPDRMLQSCSFQDRGFPAETAEQILAVWRSRRTELRRASERHGCARQLPLAAPNEARRSRPDVAVWRSFSGNNSGECILIGKFDSNADAQRFLAELAPSWAPDGEYSAEWRALFQRENVALSALRDNGEPVGTSPNQILAIGRSVIALGYDSGDAFPELRALTWKRAGFVVPGGIHIHGSSSLLGVIRCRDSDDAKALVARGADFELFPHGELLFVHIPAATNDDALERHAQRLSSFAEGRPLSAELVLDDWDASAFLAAKQRLGNELATEPRLLVSFWGEHPRDDAKHFAEQLSEATVHVCHRSVLIEGLNRRKRVAVLALRQGAIVRALGGREVQVGGMFWFLEPAPQKGVKAPLRPTVDLEALSRALSTRVGKPVSAELSEWNKGGKARIVTDNPAAVLAAMASVAEEIGAQLNPWVVDVDSMAHLLRRLIADVSS
ncbi:MAG TPA: radical SAM protein [Polyangiaceae bacterium]|nr:radical SAM protein [Polyangiaceae bacterium]